MEILAMNRVQRMPLLAVLTVVLTTTVHAADKLEGMFFSDSFEDTNLAACSRNGRQYGACPKIPRAYRGGRRIHATYLQTLGPPVAN